MPKKSAAPITKTIHVTSQHDYKSDLFGNMVEGRCSCGWMLRYKTLEQAIQGCSTHEASV